MALEAFLGVLRRILIKMELYRDPWDPPSGPVLCLPPEMWKMIVTEHVKDPQDQHNCSMVCVAWADFLKDDMDTIRFHLVFPKTLEYLGSDDVLNCSRVSHDWNKVVDSTISKIIGDTSPDDMDRARQHSLDIISQFTQIFSTKQNVDEFVAFVFPQYPVGTPVNPIIYRKFTLFLSNETPEELIALVSRLCETLKICGHFIHDLEIYFRGFDIYPDNLLRHFFPLIPNLRSLKFSGYLSPKFGTVESENEELPPLKHLKSVTLYFKCPKFNLMILKSYGHQLSNLILREPNFSLEEMRPFAELKTLKLELLRESCMIFYHKLFENQTPQLTTLNVEISLKERCGPTYVASLVTLINSFGNSLETLKMTSSLPPQLLEPKQLTGLKLGNLKNLIFNGMIMPKMDFLKVFAPTLETLLVGGHVMDEVCLGKKLAFYKQLYEEHDFWKRMKKIKMVRMDVAMIILAEPGDGPDDVEVHGYKAEQRTFQYTRDVYENMHPRSKSGCSLQ